MTYTNPFFDFDAQKLMADFKLPNVDSGAVIDLFQRNVEAVVNANQTAFAGLQAISQRQGELVSKTVETSSKSIQDVMATEALEERLAKQTAFIKDSYAEAVSNAKELSDMMATASGDALDIISKRATATLDEVTTIITKK